GGRQHYNIGQSLRDTVLLNTVTPRSKREKIVASSDAGSEWRGTRREGDTVPQSGVGQSGGQKADKVGFDDACGRTPQVVDVEDDD
ncbi:hypothetical protein PFISCL1PPCAC_16925, partial [Pristionchus fissidentatus]